MFDTKPFEDRMKQAVQHFEEELKTVRTGRAHVSMLDSVMVDAYGQAVPLKQVANVTAPEAQLLQITPFDPTTLQSIVVAIRDNKSLDMNPSDDGRIVRVPVPQLTEERRQQMVKVVSEKVEDCRIALRNVRQDALKAAKTKKDVKELSDDDIKHIEKGIDDDMRGFQTEIDQLFHTKQQEIMTV